MTGPEFPFAREFAAGVQHQMAGRYAEAEAIYRRLLGARPGDPDVLRHLGVLHFQRGDAPSAERLLRETLAAAPGDPGAHHNLALILHKQKRDDEALVLLQRAVELAPRSDALLSSLGGLLTEMGRTREAVEAFQRAVTINPRNLEVRQNLGTELLKVGEPREALRHLEACEALGLINTTISAYKAVALNELGETSRLRALVDFDRLVVRRHIGDAHGAGSLQAFSQDLAKAVITCSTLHEHHTTVNGMDTAELFDLPDPSVAALRRFIYSEIEARLSNLPERSHPFARTAPRTWSTISWGVKMWRQGHQVTHIHHKAWLSGVYYVQLPEVVHTKPEGHEAWIEFGRGPDELHAREPETRLIQPVEGMLITFPSYVWHRTIPFESERERISIAFDVIPA
jgi:tetratricopeptide (TPR) repeat protein